MAEITVKVPIKGHCPLGRVFLAVWNFLLFKDQLVEGGHQKTKDIIVLHWKFRLVENSLNIVFFFYLSWTALLILIFHAFLRRQNLVDSVIKLQGMYHKTLYLTQSCYIMC